MGVGFRKFQRKVEGREGGVTAHDFILAPDLFVRVVRQGRVRFYSHKIFDLEEVPYEVSELLTAFLKGSSSPPVALQRYFNKWAVELGEPSVTYNGNGVTWNE